jgi:hypothetical protein
LKPVAASTDEVYEVIVCESFRFSNVQGAAQAGGLRLCQTPLH